MKSKRAKDYLREQEKMLYTSKVWGDKVPAVPSVCALRAVEIAEEELQAQGYGQPAEWMIKALKAIRFKVTRGDIHTARIMINNLLIEMKG